MISYTSSIYVMMQNTNPCTRCGKERVVFKTWKEESETYFGSSTITHIEAACPDKECQAIVNQGLQLQKEKRDKVKRDREERLLKSRRK